MRNLEIHLYNLHLQWGNSKFFLLLFSLFVCFLLLYLSLCLNRINFYPTGSNLSNAMVTHSSRFPAFRASHMCFLQISIGSLPNKQERFPFLTQFLCRGKTENDNGSSIPFSSALIKLKTNRNSNSVFFCCRKTVGSKVRAFHTFND